ncbi:MAG: MBL fold metallo-hydrolase [Lentisphaerota bacterium]
MALQVCVLGSGSSGNCIYVSTETTSILIDAGLSVREITRRLDSIQASLARVQAVCISHEHDDHTSALGVLHRKLGIPLFGNAGTVEALRQNPKLAGVAGWKIFANGEKFPVGDLKIEPFSVPHDAYDPVGFIIRAQGIKIGMATDIGMVTGLVRERLKDCSLLIIESNHDEDLLHAAERPWHLKQRILGRQGHLSNECAAEVVAQVAGPGLRQVYLAHISKDCNRHDLALRTARTRLDKAGFTGVRVSLTFPDQVSDIWKSE